MKCVKIIDNLYLGDKISVPSDCDIEIATARELFLDYAETREQLKKGYYWRDNVLYMDFYDFPVGESQIDIKLIHKFLETIKINIKNKKIYVHCVWGVNRSPSLVFLYLIINNIYSATDLSTSLKKFKKIYPSFFMNPGWYIFVKKHYPFDEFK